MTFESNNTNPVTTKPRGWFRFRLRTLLVVVTLLSAPLGWIGLELDQRRREKAVIAWVEEMGGAVYFYSLDFNTDLSSLLQEDERSWWEKKKDEWFGERVQYIGLKFSHVSDLSALRALKDLKRIDLRFTQVSDVSSLRELKKLKALYFMDTQVSDLSPLAELKELYELWLRRTHVSDLSPLAELKSLRLLDLCDTEVTDLSPLAELKLLGSLDLRGTMVSDLSPLAELKNLTGLYLKNTPVTEEQVQELRQALPNCQIDF